MRGWLRARIVRGAMCAPPCSTWSQASRHFYRSPYALNGSPHLTGKAAARLGVGNATFHFAMRTGLECKRLGIPFVLENPRTSMMWSHPRMQLFSLTSCEDANVNVDFCQHGTRWRKTTLFRGWCTCQPPQPLLYRCRGRGGLCSKTGLRHISLEGGGPGGKRWTAIAEPYHRLLPPQPTFGCTALPNVACPSASATLSLGKPFL